MTVSTDPVVLDRDTGEIVDPGAATTESLSRLHRQLGELLDGLKAERQAVTDALLARIGTGKSITDNGEMAEKTVKRVWNPGATVRALTLLIEAGLVTPDDAYRACPEETIRKPSGVKLNSLLTDLAGLDVDDEEQAAAIRELRLARSEYTTVKTAEVTDA